jgi:hypothetical protein
VPFITSAHICILSLGEDTPFEGEEVLSQAMAYLPYGREPREVAEASIDEADRSYAYGQAPALRVSPGNHSNG